MIERTGATMICAALLAACAGPVGPKAPRSDPVASALASAPPASHRADPEQVLELARGYGPARRGEDKLGAPMIEAQLAGKPFAILFYGCERGRSCESVQFVAGFGAEAALSVEAANRWNAQSRFAKVYLNEAAEPVLQFDVNLAHGVSRANLDDTIDWWAVAMRDFAAYLSGLEPSDAETPGG